MEWGLLGPEHLGVLRRTRALGVGSAVRKFNQLAVPGLGGVWFGKQMVLATLGVIVADRLRLKSQSIRPIEITNAIEALACWYAFQKNGWDRDARLRGIRKLAAKSDLSFSKLRLPSFYVTQPMRMATVEALVDLGFVDPGSQRFNSFRSTNLGREFVDAATAGYRPQNASVEDYLVKLIAEDLPVPASSRLEQALSPLQSLGQNACHLLRSTLCEGAGRNRNAARRKNGLAWIASIRQDQPANWNAKPGSIDADHWDDLRLGSRFFAVRDAAIDVLDAIETVMAPPRQSARIAAEEAARLPVVEVKHSVLRRVARAYLDEPTRDPTERQMASVFCRICIDEDPVQVVRNLVMRDDRVLILRGLDILPGPAFSGRQRPDDAEDGEGPDDETVNRVPVPPGISPRIRNLYLLELDLCGKLDGFLNPTVTEDAA